MWCGACCQIQANAQYMAWVFVSSEPAVKPARLNTGLAYFGLETGYGESFVFFGALRYGRHILPPPHRPPFPVSCSSGTVSHHELFRQYSSLSPIPRPLFPAIMSKKPRPR